MTVLLSRGGRYIPYIHTEALLKTTGMMVGLSQTMHRIEAWLKLTGLYDVCAAKEASLKAIYIIGESLTMYRKEAWLNVTVI